MNGMFPVTLSYVSGGPATHSLQPLPVSGPRGPYYVKGVMGRLHLEWTAAATSNAVAGRRMLEVLQSLTLGSAKAAVGVENLSGQAIRWLTRTLTGRAPVDAADQGANGNATITREIAFYIPFSDKRSLSPDDTAIPAGYLQRGRVAIQWVANNFFGTGNVITANTFLHLNFVLQELEDEVRASSRVLYRQIGFERYLNGAIQPGILTDLLLTPIDGSTELDVDDFTTFVFRSDGTAVIQEIDVDELVDAFNKTMVQDGAGEANAPELSASTQVEEVPLIWPGNQYKLSKQHYAESSFSYNLNQGSSPKAVNTIMFLERRILPNTDADIVAQIASCGCDEGKVRKALQVAASLPPDKAGDIVKFKTLSKVPIRGAKAGRLAPFLPVRVDHERFEAIAAAAGQGK